MKIAAFFRRLIRESRAVAVVEFGLALPLMTAIAFTGAELTNFVTTKMRISQLALHVADNAARIGTGTVLANKQITEAQINDLLTGANLQGGRLDLYGKGRVILSSIEPVANPNPTNRYRIRWQRCRGSKSWPSSYGRSGDSNLSGITVGGQTATAPDDGALMFVEIVYDYQPLIARLFIPQDQITAVAAMTVRDQRDYGGGSNGIYNNENVVPSTC
ncbi:TadE/TadG family type IV pilus assembly protein [Sphingobium cupriresistens]|uniref:Tight adherence protein TadE n=1 Tax=Sphingobium cupriresistens LL01 TaxID=1420583 RepID=A0A0J8AMH6_9SPHN|nr:tight adherence protein TadE [Sphingobium cupriresistens]KMS55760.1 tight adherence protein TadE [Sphingobium cupriresistens LL01]